MTVCVCMCASITQMEALAHATCRPRRDRVNAELTVVYSGEKGEPEPNAKGGADDGPQHLRRYAL